MSTVVPASSRSWKQSSFVQFAANVVSAGFCFSLASLVVCGLIAICEFVIPFDASSVTLVVLAFYIGFSESVFYVRLDSPQDLASTVGGLAIVGEICYLAYGNAWWAMWLPLLVPGAYFLGVSLNRFRKRNDRSRA